MSGSFWKTISYAEITFRYATSTRYTQIGVGHIYVEGVGGVKFHNTFCVCHFGSHTKPCACEDFGISSTKIV